MGYGKKTDFQLRKTYDLDKTYQHIIKPAVEQAGYRCIRGDEIQESGIIDKSMYGLLIRADLVIADITTFNPNAIYELGVRHASRPFATIIMKDGEGHIPFDLNHSKIFMYNHAGDGIFYEEVERCRSQLISLIEEVERTQAIDSPVFTFMNHLSPHEFVEEDYASIVERLANQENHVAALVDNANRYMKQDNFVEAAANWEKASRIAVNEPFFIQQLALCTYKSDPTERDVLSKALDIISELDHEDHEYNDPETLGIKGAIYKNLWYLDQDPHMLECAMKSYRDGFRINTDYYTGENYALCANIKASIVKDEREKLYYTMEAEKTRMEILEIIERRLEEGIADPKWLYASMANCLFGIGKGEEAKQFEEKFYAAAGADWEIRTYEKSKKELLGVV